MHQQRARVQHERPSRRPRPCNLHIIGARFRGCCIIMVLTGCTMWP